MTKAGGLPEAQLAMMRSMLSHPEAGEAARETIDRQVREMSGVIGGPFLLPRIPTVNTTARYSNVQHAGLRRRSSDHQ